MKFLYSDKSLARCDALIAILESNGIECVMKNEYMPFNTSGIGVFGVKPTLPEIWVVDDDQYDDACELLAEVGDDEAGGQGTDGS